MGLANVAKAVWELLMEWEVRTRWLNSRLACDGPQGCRVRVGGGSKLEVGVLVEERNFAKFFGEFARDHFGKCHEVSARVGSHVEAVLERSSASAVQTQDPKIKVSPWLKATVGLMEIKAVEFAMRSSARSPTWHASC
jgi:hypothetical protein